ncbi:MAG: nucleotidyltransferase [Oscillospiraceae bacterium]|nr:nucleotidyltransferase [Oscillospiraceae bacterium]
MKKPVLVVMAAGMGSRYGGLKQIDPVGSQGEAILDYSLFDAYEAGFRTAVIIIKEAIRADFMATVGKRLEKSPLEIRYAFQELDKLPEGYSVPADRVKPWGTSQCLLCAQEEIDNAPFAVINADDYYGKDAFKVIYEYLCNAKEGDVMDCCMVGYLLKNTVTEHGSVARGVCTANENGYLADIVERTQIAKREGGIAFTEDGKTWTPLSEDTIVSMNMWGLVPGFLPNVEKQFPNFLETQVPGNPLKAEFLLPRSVDTLLKEGKLTVKVLTSSDKWYGVTYAADKPVVVAALADLTAQGKYPDGLWK